MLSGKIPSGETARIILIILFLLIPLNILISSDLEFSMTEWDLGTVDQDEYYAVDLMIENRGTDPVKVSLMSTCGCLSVQPQEGVVEPGGVFTAEMVFDSFDDRGDFEKIMIIRTTHPELPKAFFMVRGSVKGSFNSEDNAEIEQAGDQDVSDLPEDNPEKLVFDYYFSSSCRECRIFLSETVPAIAERLNVTLGENRKEIEDPEVFEELTERLEENGLASRGFPVVVFKGVFLQGEDAIDLYFEKLLSGEISDIPEEESVGTFSGKGLKILPVAAAGLLDGVNPCAFTTLIFLLTALAVAGKSRREILIIGIFFTVSVYVTYYLVGLGFFGVLRAAESFQTVSTVIRWLLVAVLLVFAFLSFLDYLKIRKNRANKIILQLPKSMKKRIHKSVRNYTRSTALVGSSIIMGFLVSVFELGCTGQIYFPTITYMIKTEGGMSGYLMLGIYNLAFIIPLAGVFLVTFRGVSSERVTVFFKRHLGTVKLVTVFLFLSLAVVTVLT